jgi:hypothetical protein
VADIFVSYTSDDRDWAFWIGQELLKLGHAARMRWDAVASALDPNLETGDPSARRFRGKSAFVK